MSSRRIDRDGVSLHAEVDGPEDGPAVVFLHGVTASGRTWEWLPSSLTNGRKIIRLDFRGHGLSDHAAGTYSLESHGLDVATTIRELSPDGPAVVVGHSLGGLTAWWVTQHHPELVRAALLEDPPLIRAASAGTRSPMAPFFEEMQAAIIHERETGASEAEIAERITGTPIGPAPAPRFGDLLENDAVAAMAFGQSRVDVGVLDRVIDGQERIGLDHRSPVSRPVLIVRGDDAKSPAFTSVHAAELADIAPQVKVMVVPGSDHQIHDGRISRLQFTDYLRQFLAEHAPRGPSEVPEKTRSQPKRRCDTLVP